MNVFEIWAVFGFESVITFGVAEVLGQESPPVIVVVSMVDL